MLNYDVIIEYSFYYVVLVIGQISFRWPPRELPVSL